MKNIPVKIDNISSLSAAEFNPNQEELENAVTTTGQTLAEANEFQLSESMARYAATGGVFYQDSGVADAYVLGALGSFIVPAVYLDGMEGVFKTTNASTGASTINIAGIGVKSLTLPDGTAISTEITANEYHSVRYNLADDRVELVNVSQSGATSSGGLLKSVQTFTADGTWTKPAGITSVRVKLVGSGGGGGDASSNNGAGGGGAGGYSEGIFDVTSTTSETVTIGAVGAGGGPNANGNSGGTTSFGALISASGGGGGDTGGIGGVGGVGSSGDINLKGGEGGTGGSGDAADPESGGIGGASYFGGGGTGGNQTGPSRNGSAVGSGGGGNGESGSVGGDGAPGMVIVWEYS